MVVNADVDSMGGVIDGGVDISSAPSPQPSSVLEKTRAELRETFSAAEKFRKELEFLRKGGDPLDLKTGNAASVSLQSTSLTDQHPEQYVTSEVKGSSFAETASPSVTEPNSADNLMLFDGGLPHHHRTNNTIPADVALQLPKKSYKRRIRSRPNRDGSRTGQPFFPSNSNPKSPTVHKNITSNNRLEGKLNGIQTQKSTLGQPITFDEPPCIDTNTVGNRDLTGQTNDCISEEPLVKKGFESMSSIIRNIDFNESMELNLALKEAPNMEGNNVISVKDDKILNMANDSTEETAYQDSVLEEARIIEEKRKRIAGLSVGIVSSESNHRSHWHFVLDEMSWLANDFAQERLWKTTAAAQISRKAAYNSQTRFQQQNSLWKQKKVARTLAEAVIEFWHKLQVKCHEFELKGSKKDTSPRLHQYVTRFLEYNNSYHTHDSSEAQAPNTPDRISDDVSIIDILSEDNLTEDNLFYVVPPGAIEAYRKSIESHLIQCERTGSSMQEEVDATGYDLVADDIFEENEGETSTYFFPGAFERSKSSKPTQKKRKQFRSNGSRSYETGPDSSFIQSRPASCTNVSIPTKRVRTASRPRFMGPSGFVPAPNRADGSSGDTNSFQDELSCLRGGSHVPNNTEAESVFDLTDVSNRPKKKKKAKHPGSVFEHRWQLDSSFQNDKKDHSKRRLDTRQFDSNGNSVASQTSNMSNPNKFMKLLVRDCGRKAKSLKTPAGEEDSGSLWSLFEDQALVVLVHDMGANWELISDAINSTLQFKCVSRNPEECKQRHKILMDRTGDGADSADDSGSSQPYPSTLPGIPEGSARQLFQRLKGPIEEETLKSHFEKIIMIWRKQRYRKAQKDNQEPKQLQQPHGSHALALSQVCPNNLNGGPVLTPFDLCDANSPTPDCVPVGYQGPNHGLAPTVHGSSSGSSLPPGSSATALGTQLPSASAPLSPFVRERKYVIPVGGSLSTDEQQYRLQQFNQLSARNIQSSSGPHSGTVPPGGARTGVITAMNRSMTMTRPGFQGINSPPSMLNVGVTPGNMQSAVGQGQGNSVRPREALHMMRPNQNISPDLLMPHQPHVPSPHMPTSNPRPRHQVFGGPHFIKERQLHQQRLLQHQFPSSNPIMPRVQPQPPRQHPPFPPPGRQHPQQPTKAIKGGPPSSSTLPVITTSSDHRQPRPPQKLTGQTKVTAGQTKATAGQKVVDKVSGSPPRSNSAGSGGVRNGSESDSLVNSVQWQQKPSS